MNTLRAQAGMSAPNIHVPAEPTPKEINLALEAAAMLSAGAEGVEKHYDAKTLDAASEHVGIGLQGLLHVAACYNGFRGFYRGNHDQVMRYAFGKHRQYVRAGVLSIINIEGILSNIASKFLLEGFGTVEDTWRRICTIRSVRDFKEVKSFRLTGDMAYAEVPPDGEVTYGELGETAYANKASLFARLWRATYQDIVNDDLGAITDIAKTHGRGAALKLNYVFWGKFLNNSEFFTAARGNYQASAGAALGTNSVADAATLLGKMIGPSDEQLGTQPAILLTPPEIVTLANLICQTIELRDAAGNKIGSQNAGRLRHEVSKYLSDTRLEGSSQKAWYLLAEPRELSTIEVVFLKGKQEPTISAIEPDFNTGGLAVVGYHAFGAAELQEHRGGVKSKGEE